MNISPNFTWEEVTFSETASREDIDNTIPFELKENALAQSELMEKVRSILGKPIFITSWYRCDKLNTFLGSSFKSDHRLALACDFKSPFGSPYEVCKKIESSDIKFGQLIHEFNSWTHISLGNKRELLTAKKIKGKTQYLTGILP
jgi:hypothetical protein